MVKVTIPDILQKQSPLVLIKRINYKNHALIAQVPTRENTRVGLIHNALFYMASKQFNFTSQNDGHMSNFSASDLIKQNFKDHHHIKS